MEEVLHKTVFPEEEILEVIQLLVRDGFIDISRGGDLLLRQPQILHNQPRLFYPQVFG